MNATDTSETGNTKIFLSYAEADTPKFMLEGGALE
jgi:hypothetical protein